MVARGLLKPSAPEAGDSDGRATQSAPSAHGAGRAIVIQLMAWGATIPTGLVITALLAHYLGAAQYGEYSFVVPLLGVFGLIGGIGMDPLIIRRLSRETRAEWPDTLSYAAGSRLISTAVSALAVIAVALLLPLSSDERLLLLIGCASLLFGFQVGSMRSVYDDAFRAEQRVMVPAVLLMIDRLLTAGLVAVAVVLHLSLLWVYFLIVYSDLPFFVAMVVISRRRFGVRVRFSVARLLGHVRTGLPLVSYDALVQVAWRADLFLLMAIAGPVSVGIYALALRVTDPLFAVVLAYVSGIYPLLCSTFEQGHSYFQRSYHEAARLLALGTIPLAVFISVEARPIVGLLGGRHFLPTIPALVILMWATAVGFFGQLVVRSCMSANLERTIPYVMGVAAGVNVVACLALIPIWQSTGAAVGALLSVVAEVTLFIILLASRAQVLPPIGALARVAAGNVPGLALLMWLRQSPVLLAGPLYVLTVVGGCYITRSFSSRDVATAWHLLVTHRRSPLAGSKSADPETAVSHDASTRPRTPNGRRQQWWHVWRERADVVSVTMVRLAHHGVACWRSANFRTQAALASAAARPDRAWLRSLLRTWGMMPSVIMRWRTQQTAYLLRLARQLDEHASHLVIAHRHSGSEAMGSADTTGALAVAVPVESDPRTALRVTISHGRDAIAALADEWTALLERASRPTVFQSPEWLGTWSRHLNNGAPWLVQVRAEDGTLVGIVPLQLLRPGVGPLRLGIMRWLGYGKGALTDSLGPVFATGYETDGMRAALTFLVRELPASTILDLDRNTAELTAAIRLWAPDSGCRVQVFKSAGWLYVRLPEDWPTLQRALSKNLRSNLPRYRNRLKREGHAQSVSVLTDPEAVMAALPCFLDLHAWRAQASGLKYHSNYFASPASRAFIHEVARILSAQGRMAIAQMDVDGTIVAAQLLLFQGQTMTTYFSGFDPDWSRYSVMLLTQQACIEYAIAHGLWWVDLTAGAGGEDQTKRQWGNEETLTTHIMISRQTIAGASSNWLLQRWYIVRRLQMWTRQTRRRSLLYILRLPVAEPASATGTATPLQTSEDAALPEEVGSP